MQITLKFIDIFHKIFIIITEDLLKSSIRIKVHTKKKWKLPQ